MARTSTAIWKNPSAIAGSRSERTPGQSPFDQPAKPPDCTQPRCTENRRIRSRPAQNPGIAMPICETTIAR